MRMTSAMRTMTLGAATLFSAAAAGALEIDPGAIGSEFQFVPITVQASDLTGNVLDITFADMKHLELAGNDVLYSFGLSEATGVLDGIDFDGFLSDELGQQIPNSAFSGTFATNGWINGNRGFEDPTVIHDVHFTFLSTPQFPFDAFFAIAVETGDPKPVVGAWVPEPSGVALAALALAVLGLQRRRAG